MGGKQKFARYVVTKSFDPSGSGSWLDIVRRAANTCRAKPQVREFVDECKRPRIFCVVIVDDDEGRDRICDCETAKDGFADRGVMRPEISRQ